MKAVRFSLLLLLAVPSGCAPFKASPPTPNDATGICHRRLVAFTAGASEERFETVIVRQSSNSIADIARVAEMEDARSHSPSAHHLTANRWFGAWLTDTSRDFTQGPTCTHLPAFKDKR
jgi:hypothetical protein